MEPTAAITAFTALGQPGRLAVFRLLMRRAPTGARPTEIAAALNLKANTLSHYLATLEQAGLISSRREGRALIYTVDLTQTAALVDYLVTDCGRSRPDLHSRLVAEGAQRAASPFNVLFLCTANSARSIMAEAILNRIGTGRFRAFSAGTTPARAPMPAVLELLGRQGFDTSSLCSKDADSFRAPDAPQMDFVFSVCDAAAAEECAPWPGQPLTAHWGVKDPNLATGSEAERALAYATAFSELNRRITAFAALPIAELDRLSLQNRLDRISLDQE